MNGELDYSHLKNTELVNKHLAPNGIPIVWSFSRSQVVKPKRVVDPLFSPFAPEFTGDAAYALVRDFGIEAQYKALAKYGAASRVRPPEGSIKRAFVTMYHLIGGICSGKPLTFREAIEIMDLSKSVSLPMNVIYATKREWLETSGSQDMVDFIGRLLSTSPGVHVTTWLSFLKEEVIKLAKIIEGNTRQIQGLDARMLLVGSRFFSGFNRTLMRTRLQGVHPFVTGQSPYYGGWHEMLEPLCRWKYKFCGDISLADCHYTLEMYQWEKWLRELCLGELQADDWLMFEHAWFNEVVRLTVLSDGNVAMVPGGNGSGSLNTGVRNGFLLWAMFLVYWDSLSGDMMSLRDHVLLRIAGDNVCGGYDQHARDIGFSWDAFNEFWRSRGIKSTGYEHDDVKRLDFLSHYSRTYAGYLIPYPKRVGKAWASLVQPPRKALNNVALRLVRAIGIRNLFFADAWDADSTFRRLDKMVDLVYQVAVDEGRAGDLDVIQAMAQRWSPRYLLVKHLPLDREAAELVKIDESSQDKDGP